MTATTGPTPIRSREGGRRSKWLVRRLWRSVEWPLLGTLVVASLVLGFVGFANYFVSVGVVRSGWDLLYLTLQLFVLESGSTATGVVPWELQVARLLAPAVAAYTAVKALAIVFGEQFERFRMKSFRGHVVICGLGRKGLLLARSLRARGDRVVIIEDDAENDRIEACRGYGALVLIGDSRDPQLLRKARLEKASHLVAVSGDDGVNAEVAVRARALVMNRRGRPLSCLVHVVDPQLCTLLRMQEIGRAKQEAFRLDFFNVFESGARALLSENPVTSREGDASGGRVVVVGLGRFGESLVTQAAREWRAACGGAEGRLSVTIVDRHATALAESLRVRYPWLGQACDLEPREMDLDSREFSEARFLFGAAGDVDVSRIYVCVDDDTRGLSTALTLQRHVKQQGVPIVVRMAHGTGLASLLGDGGRGEFAGLHAFGLLDGMCNPDLLFAGAYETIAREIHKEYVAEQQSRGVSRETNKAVVSWEELAEHYRESNRAQAAHIGVKLAAVGCDLAPLTDWDAEFLFDQDRDEVKEEVELLARMEHERWVLERQRDGWQLGEKREGQKTTPHLVPWEELDEGEKDKDRRFIRRLPRFLAKAGLQIVRLPPSAGSVASDPRQDGPAMGH